MFGEDVVGALKDARFSDENNRETDRLRAEGLRGIGGDDSTAAAAAIINDVRPASEFRQHTFSQYKKTEAKRELVLQMYAGKIEPANYWCAEFVCAGDFDELWETLIQFTCKYIHVTNPKVAVYLHLRYQHFKLIVDERHFVCELELRNHVKVRGIFAELVTILAVAPKSLSTYDCASAAMLRRTSAAADHPGRTTTATTATTTGTTKSSSANSNLEEEAVEEEEEEVAEISQLAEKMCAPAPTYASGFFRRGSGGQDSEEVFVAINELAFLLLESRRATDVGRAFFWIEWIVEFDAACRRRKKRCRAERRTDPAPAVAPQFQKDVIWIVWDCLFHCSARCLGDHHLQLPHVDRTLRAMHGLFCVRYRHSTPKRRKLLLYFACAFFFQEKEDFFEKGRRNRQTFSSLELVAADRRELVACAVHNVHHIYAQVKRAEVSPRTEYLFRDVRSEKTDFQKTLERLQIINRQDRKTNANALLR